MAYVDQISADGSKVFVTADNYVTTGKGGYTDSGWIAANGPTGYLHPYDVSAVATNNVAAVLADGRLVAKQGGLGTAWLNMYSGIAQVRISGNNVAALTTAGTLLGKQGGFSTGWMTLTSGVKSFDLS